MPRYDEQRRTFLRWSGGLAIAAAATGGLSGCRTDSGSTGPGESEGGSSAADLMPTYQRLDVVQPDLPGDEHGVPNAYFAFPKDPKPATNGVPGSGGKVGAMFKLAGTTPVSDLSSNPWWQGLNTRLGVEIDARMVAQDYDAKVATSVAGGDIPDLVQVPAMARLPELLEARFEDLTEYLQGDAVLEYPALAALPGYMWQTGIQGGALRAVPPGNLVGQPTWTVRQDVLAKIGADLTAATDGDSVAAMFAEVTDARTNRYALGDRGRLRSLGELMTGAPNGWKEEGGQFTHKIETAEYLAGLEYLARLWGEGVVHPDTFGSVNAPELFRGGKIPFFSWGGVGYRSLLNIEGVELKFWAPPLVDGSGIAPKRLGTGTYMLCAIRKQDSPDRVRELLRILNYLASPFGSEEYLYLKYGARGVHHTWDDELSAPVQSEALEPQRFHASTLASPPFELFDPGYRDVTKAMYEHQVETIPTGMRDAAANLYSATDDEKGTAINGVAYDIADNLVQGRVGAAGWTEAISEWRSAGGDAIRGELEASFAELKGN